MKRVIFLLLLSVLFLSCLLDEPKEIEYEVTCTSVPNTVWITITNEDGGTSQFDVAATPWTYSFEIEPPSNGRFSVYLSAQNQQDRGIVTSTIYVDGYQFSSSSSSTGAYVIATASGSVEW